MTSPSVTIQLETVLFLAHVKYSNHFSQSELNSIKRLSQHDKAKVVIKKEKRINFLYGFILLLDLTVHMQIYTSEQ